MFVVVAFSCYFAMEAVSFGRSGKPGVGSMGLATRPWGQSKE